MFLAVGRFTPTLPPTELSTIARRLVGTIRSGSPRAYVAATNPARSPTTPPPTATTHVCRSAFISTSSSNRTEARPRLFEASPAGTTAERSAIPAAARAEATRAAFVATFSSVTTRADRHPRPAHVRSSEARANSPNFADHPRSTIRIS